MKRATILQRTMIGLGLFGASLLAVNPAMTALAEKPIAQRVAQQKSQFIYYGDTRNDSRAGVEQKAKEIGGVVLPMLWATSCKPCEQQMKTLGEIMGKTKVPFTVLLVLITDDYEEGFFTFPRAASQFLVKYTPTTFFYKDGKQVGDPIFKAMPADYLTQRINDAGIGKAPAPPKPLTWGQLFSL